MKIVFKNLKYYIHANSYEECQNIKTQIYHIGQIDNSVRQKLSAVKINWEGPKQTLFKAFFLRTYCKFWNVSLIIINSYLIFWHILTFYIHQKDNFYVVI